MYRIFLSIITILCIITGGHLMSIPVFGTKRYHRTPSITSSSAASSSSLTSSNIPYYNQLSTYYDNQPTYGNNGGSLIPISNINSINNNNNNNNNYQNGYLTENGYYYYPRHEYHSYGMPTYHGDYKPTPYYYAPAPRYSYYDDRDIISNPMDDLHEEILHEDERERQRELQPLPYGQENWYQTGHNNNNNNNNNNHHQQQQQQLQQDELTNNFLKNLIEYNRQIDAQQKLQQQQQDELIQRDQEHKLQLQYQQQLEQQQQQQHQQEPFSDEYDEYVELGDDYEYEPQASENIYDMKKYERFDNTQPNYQSTTQQQQQHHQQQQQQQNVYNPLQQQQQMKSILSKHLDNDDEDVRQLKSLAHHSNIQNLKSTNNNIKSSKLLSSTAHHKTYKLNDNNNAEDIDLVDDDFNNWNQQDIQKEQPIIPIKSYAQYDNEPEEYDDDAWISWDRKRSSQSDKINKNMDKWKQSLKKIESIKAFNNRKPLIVKVKDFKDITTPKNIETSTKITTATAISNINNKKIELTTNLPIIDNNNNNNNENLLIGQKEIVIPRPATNSQSNLFNGFTIFGNNKNNNIQSKQHQIDSLNLLKSSSVAEVESTLSDNFNKDKENNLKDDEKRKGRDNVYDTIKQLLTMEQQLEKTPVASKVQKRFVTNEENLVNELNNLKRTST